MKYKNDRLPILCIKDFVGNSDYQFKKGEIYYTDFSDEFLERPFRKVFLMKDNAEYLMLFNKNKFYEYFDNCIIIN